MLPSNGKPANKKQENDHTKFLQLLSTKLSSPNRQSKKSPNDQALENADQEINTQIKKR